MYYCNVVYGLTWLESRYGSYEWVYICVLINCWAGGRGGVGGSVRGAFSWHFYDMVTCAFRTTRKTLAEVNVKGFEK